MLTHLLYTDVICFFVTSENLKNNIDGMLKSSYLPGILRNFDKIFKKDVANDNIKSHKKTASTSLSLTPVAF